MVFFCLVFAMPMCASFYMCLVVTCWERADLLALVCGVLLLVCHFSICILNLLMFCVAKSNTVSSDYVSLPDSASTGNDVIMTS